MSSAFFQLKGGYLPTLRLSNIYREITKEKAKWIIIAITISLLGLLICYPVGILFWKSLINEMGNFSLKNYVLVFTEPGLSSALKNSVIISFFTTLFSALVGIPMAFAVARTNMPLKTLVTGVVLVSFVIPSFIQAIAWILLLGPQAGFINVFLRDTLGFPFAANIFSMSGLIFVLTLNHYPYFFYSTLASLNNIDPSYEEASRMVGAPVWRTAVGISFPLVSPAIVTGAVLCFLNTMAAFGAPIAIGLPARFHVLTTKIYQLFTYPPQYELAAACATPIVLMTALALYAQKLYLGRKKFYTITGKTSHPEPIDIGKWKYAAIAFSFLVFAVAIAFPLSVLIKTSLTKIWGLPLTAQNFTLVNYYRLIDPNYEVLGSIKNSAILSVSAATVCVSICVVICWIVERIRSKVSSVLVFLCMITFAFPSAALAVGILLSFMVPPFYLQGTLAIILIGFISKKISYAFVLTRNSMKQIHPEFEEGSRLVGASWFQTIKDITMPLLKTGIIIAWILVFAACLKELAIAVFLYLPGNETISVSIYHLLDDGALEAAATLSVMISVLSIMAVFGVKKFAGKGVMEI